MNPSAIPNLYHTRKQHNAIKHWFTWGFGEAVQDVTGLKYTEEPMGVSSP